MKWKINIHEEHCTGCLICQMICSLANDGCFYPSHSLIKVQNDENDAHFRIELDNNCNNCGLCASYCTSKALLNEKR
ncbi:4Fe-4S binding domain protein [Pelotomaculum schinkii]|uniref:4Fe-4S binding domain protein n=1 Tax=Pelotomaculum schinkii TaxID=78350 RepID=A0A4Y7R712_9FIRM|nr:4Fe-4S binding domain protein [Pelotomaculum schinkii]